MAKYQIILESDEFLPDDEFEIIARNFFSYSNDKRISFKVLYVNNLQGIKKELWEKKENLKESPAYSLIETTFDEIADLFKLD